MNALPAIRFEENGRKNWLKISTRNGFPVGFNEFRFFLVLGMRGEAFHARDPFLVLFLRYVF